MIKFVLFLILNCYSLPIPSLNQQILSEIFHTNKIYAIYFTHHTNTHFEPLFRQFCQQGYNCVIIHDSLQHASNFKQFIGNQQQSQYLVILDAQGTKKYLLSLHSSITLNDLLIFQAKFQQGKLEQFYGSEKPPTEIYQPCQKIVGKTLSSFLDLQTPVKVILLYRQNGSCEICGEMLRAFGDLADHMYSPKMVRFGYLDLFKNHHPVIKNYMIPYFLIFSKKKNEPIQLPGQKFDSLYQIILDIMIEEKQNTGFEDTQVDLEFEGAGTLQEL